MKLVFFLLIMAVTASVGSARELIAHAQVDGKPVLIFDDGFWRYDDDVGEVCTVSGSQGSVCTLPSIWSRLPDTDELRYGLPVFVQGEFTAEFRVLQHWGSKPITINDVLAFIGNQTIYDGLKGTVLESTTGKLGGFEGGHVVISAGPNGVYAFTFASQNGRYLIAQTRDQDSTTYFSGHRKAHQSFVDAIRPEPFE